jgi:hypothetical protein
LQLIALADHVYGAITAHRPAVSNI